MRSKDILIGPEWANVRALYKATGFTQDELEKPIIGVVNSFNTICPGHAHLRQVVQRVIDGVYAAGGTPVEFGTIGACDGIAMGHVGMTYVLPTREMIANDIEAMAQAHQLDALVLVGSCDKIIPGMLLGAARLNLPSIFINGGPALPGHMKTKNAYGRDYVDHSIIQQSEGALKAKKITEKEFQWIEEHAVPTLGSCAMLGTANTMACLAEAMGMALPGSAAVPAVYSERFRLAFETGKAIMKLVAQDLRPRDIITLESLRNAIKVNSAIGGSTNAVLHLLAIAYESRVSLDIGEFNTIGDQIPHLVPLIPSGSYTLLDFYEAGGVPALMKQLEAVLDVSAKTCTTLTVSENLEAAQVLDTEVIRGIGDPVHRRGGIAILKGNLAPNGSVTKPSAIPDAALYFAGPAKVFESEEDALKGIRANQIQEGQVLVIRNEGPKGGPGMPEMYKAMKILVGMGLGERVCVITDGRFSGSNNGCFVGHICPEAYDDGPIAYIEDGDWIVVDVPNRTINVQDVDFAARKRNLKEKKIEGYLYQYRKQVLSASEGAVIPTY